MAKAESVPADVIALDLEDSVAPAEKPAARAAVAEAIDRFPRQGRLLYVRPNDLRSGLLEEDLAAIVRPGLDGIHLPKVNSPDTVIQVDHYLTVLERVAGLELGSVRLMAWIESAEGIVNVEATCRASPRLAAVSLGAEDYAASLGVSRNSDDTELLFARGRIINAAAASLLAVDCAEREVRDPERLQHAASAARRLGFRGKFCIHPDQVPYVNAVFAPSESERTWAAQVVQAYEGARGDGVGAVALDGAMVDFPVYLRACELIRWDERVRARGG